MAVGASVTWTHCSVLFEVTWNKTRRVCTDEPMSARTQSSVRADMGVRADASPSPPLSLPPLPSPLSLPPLCCPPGHEKIKIKLKLIFYLKLLFLVVVAGLERDKKFTIYNLQFSVFGFRFSIPKIPELPELREAWNLEMEYIRL
jgi:hypothetical protein